MDREEIKRAYTEVIVAKVKLFSCTENEIKAESDLRKMTLAARLTGAISGKNEDEREAQARAKFPDEYAALENAQASARSAKFEFDIAALRLSAARAMLRIEELAARVQTDDEGVEDAE